MSANPAARHAAALDAGAARQAPAARAANRDIGDILGTSPRTVHKHLEHVFEKLGVETRTAAAGRAMVRVRVRVRAAAR